MSALNGRRLLVVSGRDVRHPDAGGPERYLHEITRRWVAGGARVTWVAGRSPDSPARENVDGVEVVRTPVLLSRPGQRFDAVLDARTGPALAEPRLAVGRVPVVRLVHRVGPAVPARTGLAARLRRLVRRRAAGRTTVTLSPSARHELRCRHAARGPIFVVPPGVSPVAPAGERAADPTIVVVARLVPEQRLDLLLAELTTVLAQVPALRVEIIGAGPELPRLRRIMHDEAVAHAVTLHGRVSDAELAMWLRRAWLTVSTATGARCGCAVLAAAAHGVPCVALDAPGIADFVRDGRTGRLVAAPAELAPVLVRQLWALADDGHARWTAGQCRAWTERFGWDRSAELLAAVVAHQLGMTRARRQRRYARSDIATVVRFPAGVTVAPGALRVTDEVAVTGGVTDVLLNGCDDFDALGVLDRLGVSGAQVRLAGRDDLLVGPRPLPPLLTAAHEIPALRKAPERG
ncbi:MAG TPA: glycosyltransferase family 4 protein [Actinophytocola sp.]|uniref:glycosyltransferase family 4 protein n=1 Tax=Actinophytocola sp. TaxID=1872138 RepID=UPI002DBFC68D|nr:glycosyltransferase family 4 protein [Actinophytocola sp.]HEU5469368.1 glycosyltransferase family 4 protein [Actinophytocola sp.]